MNAMESELTRMQVMVMHYAEIVLEQRLRASTITSAEKQQIPSNLFSLRRAICAAQITREQIANTDPMATCQASACTNYTVMSAPPPTSQAVQSELARLRMQIEKLSGHNRTQHENVKAAYRVLAEVSGQVPLWQTSTGSSHEEI